MSHTSPQISIAERYGAPKKSLSARKQRWLIAVGLLVAFTAILYFTIGNAVGQLGHKDVGYTIHSDTSASVDYEVTKDFDVTAQCMVHVLDDSYAVVGAKTVTLPPHEGETSADRSQTFRSELRTESRGVTGVVDSCWELDR